MHSIDLTDIEPRHISASETTKDFWERIAASLNMIFGTLEEAKPGTFKLLHETHEGFFSTEQKEVVRFAVFKFEQRKHGRYEKLMIAQRHERKVPLILQVTDYGGALEIGLHFNWDLKQFPEPVWAQLDEFVNWINSKTREGGLSDHGM